MKQSFYNMVTTTWALKHVLFVIDYKVVTIHSEGKKRSIALLKTPHNQLWHNATISYKAAHLDEQFVIKVPKLFSVNTANKPLLTSPPY